jgi:hypothetical protein
LIAGIGVVTAALVLAGIGGEQVLVRLLVVACVLAVGVAAGRAAVLGTIRSKAAMPFRRRLPPSRPVLICNPWSGGGKVEKFGLVDLAKSLGVETVLLDRGLDLEQLARDAIGRRRLPGARGVDRNRARPPVRVRLGGYQEPLRSRPRLRS